MRATPFKSKVFFASIMSGTALRFGKLTLVTVFSCLLLFVAAQPSEECDKTKCPGPLAYYQDLHCKPVYKNPGDCCAVRYDCSNLNGRSTDKCYVNNHVYEIGEPLRKEDRYSACNIGCTCILGYRGVATFNCAIVDCFFGNIKPGCYRKRAPDQCCPGEEVCPEKPEDRPECVVDGKTYLDGESFSPEDNPDLSCFCGDGYKGENTEQFCTKKVSGCGTELHRGPQIIGNCVPVYYSGQSPQSSCSVSDRCQNSNDKVVTRQNSKEDKTEESNSQEASDDMKCKFGNMTMNIGDELNQATDYSSVCVKCVCEVPPVPTCQRLPDEECDVTDHPPFER